MNASEHRDSFARYLAKQLIANKEYSLQVVPEAAPLKAAADIVLMRSDGMTMTIMCLIDREADPSKRFGLSPDRIHEIGSSCLKYAGKINNAQMPIVVQIIEVGAASPTHMDFERLRPYKRKSLRSKVVISAMVIDTTARKIWSNALLHGWTHRHGYMGKLLREPRATDAEIQERTSVVPVAKNGFPFLTYALLALLGAIFAAELIHGVGPITGLGAPSLSTLIAFGGLNKSLVLESSEWYRVLTAIILHGDVVHVVMNGLSLLFVGYLLEGLVGRLWFAALFIIGGLCGSAMSLMLNDASVISVGASGAIMALFTAAYVCSFRLPLAAGRTLIQMQLMRVIIPALIPLVTTRTGAHIDFGAHLGGALSGILVGLLLLKSWARTSLTPRFRAAAATIVVAGYAVMAAAAIPVAKNFPRYGSVVILIPDNQLPTTDADALATADLTSRYPDDPRSHWFRAVTLIKANQVADAENALRAALAKWDGAKWQLQPEFEVRLRIVLAEILMHQRRSEEAKSIAAPACTSDHNSSLRSQLSQLQLCG